MVGTFYSSSSPDTPPYVSVGDRVSKDSIVCIVEAMKLFNEIDADIDGEIVEILVNNGQLVEYGQPLFLVKSVIKGVFVMIKSINSQSWGNCCTNYSCL